MSGAQTVVSGVCGVLRRLVKSTGAWVCLQTCVDASSAGVCCRRWSSLLEGCSLLWRTAQDPGVHGAGLGLAGRSIAALVHPFHSCRRCCRRSSPPGAGKAGWIAGTSFLILIVPLIIEMDREQQVRGVRQAEVCAHARCSSKLDLGATCSCLGSGQDSCCTHLALTLCMFAPCSLWSLRALS